MPPPKLRDLAHKIKTHHQAATGAADSWIAHARAAGQLLITAKRQVAHGDWLSWLRDHCELSTRTAQNYMRLARLDGGDAQRVADLSLREAVRTVARKKQPSSTPLFSNDRIVEEAFQHFRRSGFPYRKVPIHVAIQTLNKLAATSQPALLSSSLGYDVADTYHPHRFRASGAGHLSPVDAFERDDLLRRALRKELEQGNPIPSGYFSGLTIVSGAQPCSNFRPGVALHYYRRFCKAGATVLDTSTGYGGRLVGFLASGLAGRYIGVDPNQHTHDGNLALATDLGFSQVIELHRLPAEDVDLEVLRGRCDFALTSPPYFSKEHYSDDPTQSWRRYPRGEAWRDGFLAPMLRLQFAALKPGAINIVNIDDVVIKGKRYPLTDWTKSLATAAGFDLVDVEQLSLPAAYWAKVHDTDASEPVFIFRKP